MIENIKRWDRELLVYLNNLEVFSLDSFWATVTQTVFWIPFFLLFIFLIYKAFQTKKAHFVFFYLLTAVGFSLFLMTVTKNLIGRPRPNTVSEIASLIKVLYQPQGYSFYSGHASSSFLIATFLILTLKKYRPWIWLVLIFPLVFAFSRIFVGVHYPLDILFGAVVGILIAWGFYQYFIKKIISPE